MDADHLPPVTARVEDPVSRSGWQYYMNDQHQDTMTHSTTTRSNKQMKASKKHFMWS